MNEDIDLAKIFGYLRCNFRNRIACIVDIPLVLPNLLRNVFRLVESMIEYSKANAPLAKDLTAEEIGQSAAFLSSTLAAAISGVTLYVDNGLHAMGLAVDSPALVVQQPQCCGS